MGSAQADRPRGRKKSEASLQEQYHFMRQLLDTLPNPVFFKDERGRYLGCNRAFEECTGLRREKLLGKSAHDIAPKKLADVYVAADRELFRNPGTQIFEASVRYADGMPRNVLFYKATFSKTDGSLGGLVGVLLDITERKAAEQEQLALEAGLRQAQKMESIGHLCGGIAHDFNNILSAILGYSELCRMFDNGQSSEKIVLFIDEIRRAAFRARDLVAQLLAFSRSGEASVDAVIVAPVVSEVLKLLRSILPATLIVDVEMAEDLPEVRISPVQLHQILMNLGINARDAICEKGEKGRMAVHVSAVELAARTLCASCHGNFCGSFVRIAVADDGHGILPEDRTRIFDPFFTTKETGKGSGLGLSVLHGIVHAAGGHIEVDSEAGCGSEFCVYLPALASRRPAAALADEPVESWSLRGHVLVVDDEAAIVGFITTLLESSGCTVTGCTDPQVALRLFQNAPASFDLLIADQTMPGLTGCELASECLSCRHDLPVILCTGDARTVGAFAPRAPGIGALLQKPVTASVLARQVKTLLNRKPRA